jgi:alkanesulfonate monooxygenase SsuD/methylene tetrahydromethanopterin reductase-like flavin-dependent oxidoreductase (luciferase family)
VTHPLRFGLKVSQQGHPIAVQREGWRIADEAGFDHLWPFDHLVALHAPPTTPIFDGWTLLGAIAASTARIRMGLNVSGNLYRHPALLAKMAVTVDHLSGGRLEVGLGASWNEAEFAMFGLAFPGRPADRISMLEESCRVLKLLWSEERATFSGRHYRLSDAISEPKPLQRPHPLMWIGGKGPTRTLRVAAAHADVWHSDVWHADVGAAQGSWDLATVLDGHCAALGRDPRSIRRGHSLLTDDAEAALRHVEASVRHGFSEFLLFPSGVTSGGDHLLGVEAAARLLPRLRELGPLAQASTRP